MTSQPFGFPERAACPHSTVYRELGGVAIRYCEGCGQTYLLWQFDDGEMALLPVPELDSSGWERVRQEKAEETPEEVQIDDTLVDMVETLLNVPAGEDERPVPQKPKRRRRAAQPVPDVQEPEQPLRQKTEAR